ncbi:MAG: hypothetical protein ABIR91_02065, partial [Candidatus Saccharimonadales bacterium]
MVNTLFKAVDKAPFAGKYAVQNSIHNLVKAPRSKERSQLLKAVTARQTSLAVRAGSIHYKRSRKREQKPKVTPA